MGRKARLSREMILEAAWWILDTSGIGAVTIKSVAEALGCSTQPISWHFGSMTEMKKALWAYAAFRLYGSLEEEMKKMDAVGAFLYSGIRYISNACDHPRVFRFLNIDDPLETVGEEMRGEKSIFSTQMDEFAVRMLSETYRVSPERIGEAVQNTVIYTHGLAVMMMWDRYRLDKGKACRMIFEIGTRMLRDAGIRMNREEMVRWQSMIPGSADAES